MYTVKPSLGFLATALAMATMCTGLSRAEDETVSGTLTVTQDLVVEGSIQQVSQAHLSVVDGDLAVGGALSVSGAVVVAAQGDVSMGQFTTGTNPAAVPGMLGVNVSVPVGTVIAWCKTLSGVPNTLPDCWMECDGSAVTDPASPLYRDPAVETAICVPNLNAAAGKSPAFLCGAATSGTEGGEEAVTLDTTQMPSHQHGYRRPVGAPIWVAPGGMAASGPSGYFPQTDPAGGGQAHENRPPFYSVVWIMKIK